MLCWCGLKCHSRILQPYRNEVVNGEVAANSWFLCIYKVNEDDMFFKFRKLWTSSVREHSVCKSPTNCQKLSSFFNIEISVGRDRRRNYSSLRLQPSHMQWSQLLQPSPLLLKLRCLPLTEHKLELECGVSMSPCTILCLYFESKDEWIVHCSAPKWVVSALKPLRIVVILSSATTKNIPWIERQRGVLWWCSWNTVLGRSKT